MPALAIGRGRSGLQVGVDVATTKPVDGLLGVAHQEQGNGAVKEKLKQAPLDGIGVLELVDEAGGHVLPRQPLQPLALRGVQPPGIDAAQQVGEIQLKGFGTPANGIATNGVGKGAAHLLGWTVQPGFQLLQPLATGMGQLLAFLVQKLLHQLTVDGFAQGHGSTSGISGSSRVAEGGELFGNGRNSLDKAGFAPAPGEPGELLLQHRRPLGPLLLHRCPAIGKLLLRGGFAGRIAQGEVAVAVHVSRQAQQRRLAEATCGRQPGQPLDRAVAEVTQPPVGNQLLQDQVVVGIDFGGGIHAQQGATTLHQLLDEAVDGGDGRTVETFHRQQQPLQALQQLIVTALAAPLLQQQGQGRVAATAG